jgi:drug/metabolite transporter (DMT)-like permease
MTAAAKGHVFALITVTIWSSTFIVSKFLLAQLMPLQILGARFLLAILFLSLLDPKFKKPSSMKEEALFLSIGTVLAGYFLFENNALQRTYSSHVSLIVATIPLLTGLLSMAVSKKSFLNVRSIIGFAIAYSGVLLIIINGRRMEGSKPMGDFLALGAAVMFAVYSVLMEKVPAGHTLVQLTRKVFIYAFLILIAFLVADGRPVPLEVITTPVILSLLFLGLVASSLAFILWNQAIKAIGSVQTNQYIYLVPVFTAIFAVIFLNEKITILTVAGAALILSGLYLSEKARG